MATVIVNDVEMTARPGERILDIARRNSAHIGFVCDGTGFVRPARCGCWQGLSFSAHRMIGRRTGCQMHVSRKDGVSVARRQYAAKGRLR